MRTAELTGALLDYWVARAEGLMPAIGDGACYLPQGGAGWYRPSSDWAQGGPIIEHEKIALHMPGHERAPDEHSWGAYLEGEDDEGLVPSYWGVGETPLIAAMRAYVASKFGTTVDDA